MTMPRVSVIIPTYNRRDYVQEAIDSVLAQTYTDYEIIVVDDGSTDGTGEALQARYGDRIRYVWQENQGESVARNRGIEMAQGEYVAFLDSDDLWLPEKIERQVKLIDQNSALGLVFCEAEKIDANGRIMPGPPMGSEYRHLEPTFENLYLYNFVGTPSKVLVRTSVLREIGGFDEAMRYGEDWDLWLRAILVTNFQGIPEPLAKVRLHRGGQWWYPNPRTVDDILKDHLLRLERAWTAWPGENEGAESMRARAVAREHATAAWAYYAFGAFEKGRDHLEIAMTLDPDTYSDTQTITTSILNTAVLLSQMEPDNLDATRHYVCATLQHLPTRYSFSKQRCRLIGAAEIEVGYSFYAMGNGQHARLHLLRGVMSDPRWLRNRGVVKALLELYGGRRFIGLVNRLRTIRG